MHRRAPPTTSAAPLPRLRRASCHLRPRRASALRLQPSPSYRPPPLHASGRHLRRPAPSRHWAASAAPRLHAPPRRSPAYAAEGSAFYFTTPDGGIRRLFTRTWRPRPPCRPKALVFMVHGYGNDISWTFQSTAVFLAQSGFSCFAADLPGHGRSHGLKAFVPDLDSAIDDLLAFFRSVKEQPDHAGLPCFLFGESMGGAICLLIHLRTPLGEWAGAVLVAPMCKISDRIRPRWPLPEILTFVARFAPTLAIVPTADLIEKSVKVPAKRVVAARNPVRYNGKPRLGTVVELLRVTDELGARLGEVSIPFLVVHGSADEVTDPEVSRALYQAAASKDKTLKLYDGMLHSLLFGEPDENIERVRADIVAWLNDRCAQAAST